MCTLSLVMREYGYLIAMNRDEKLARGAGTAPGVHDASGIKSAYPDDGAGGTWIGVNACGIALALLNWNDVSAFAKMQRRVSRGALIPALLRASSMSELNSALNRLRLEGTIPFRLVGVSPTEKTVREWRWNSSQLDCEHHRWETRHWFSSSLSDHQASDLRGQTCDEALREPDAGCARWLRRLHRSHVGGPGPFSVCVHRPDVETLSYTEIECMAGEVDMSHYIGNPCTMATRRDAEPLSHISLRLDAAANF